MKIREMTDEAFVREIAALLARVQSWSLRLSGIQPDFSLTPHPASYMDGSGEQPFPLALELKRIWDYARGTGPRPAEQREIIQDLCELLWCPIGAVGEYTIPAWWWDTPLGQMCLMAQVRAAIEHGEAISADEFAVLADLTGQRIRQMCAAGEIKAKKVRREENSQLEWAIPAKEAVRFLKARDLWHGERKAPERREEQRNEV